MYNSSLYFDYMNMRVLFYLIIFLFSSNFSYADEFLPRSNEKTVQTNKTESQETVHNSIIAPEDYILNLEDERNNQKLDSGDNILTNKDSSNDVEQEQDLNIAIQLPPNLANEDLKPQDDRDIDSLEFEQHNQKETNKAIASNDNVINLEKQENDQIGELDENVLSNEDSLSKTQQSFKNLNRPNSINQGLKVDKDDEGNSLQKLEKYNHKKDGGITSDTSNKFDTKKNNNQNKEESYNSNEENIKDDNDLKFPQLEDLFKDEVTAWQHKVIPNNNIYKRLSENNNMHLPKAVYIQYYYKQIFYCITKNDVFGLRAIINKLEDVGMSLNDIFALKIGPVDSLLTYAVKTNNRDIVDFLLHKGVDFNTANNDREALLSIAVKNGYFDVANSIVQVKNASSKKIINNLDSDMYKWAMEVKHNKP